MNLHYLHEAHEEGNFETPRSVNIGEKDDADVGRKKNGQAMNFGALAGDDDTEASAICPRLFKHTVTVVGLNNVLMES